MKTIIVLFAVSALTACSFFGASQEEIDAAVNAYEDARASVDMAAGKQLDVSIAKAELEKSRLELDDEEYEASIAHSTAARQMADNLIAEHDRLRAAEMEQERQRQRMIEQQAQAEQKRQEALRMAGTEHVVVEGDTLWSIARKSGELNNPLLWPVIYKSNASIDNPDLISIGQKLVIRQPGEAESSAAIRYSTRRLKASDDSLRSLDESYKAGD